MLFSTLFVFPRFSGGNVAGLPNFERSRSCFQVGEICMVAFLVKFGRSGFVENRARWKYLDYVYNNEISLRDWGWFTG